MNKLFVSEITTLDLCLVHPLHGLVGETLICDLELSGDVDEHGFIFDFGKVKKAVKAFLDLKYDHKLVLSGPDNNPLMSLTMVAQDGSGERINLELKTTSGTWKYAAPADAVTLVSSLKTLVAKSESDYRELEKYISQEIFEVLPSNVSEARVTLRSEGIEHPFHYCHGLRSHYGNCQRMAHGHRSRIHVFLDDKEDLSLNKFWADKLNFKHLVSEEHVVERNNHTVTLAYEGNQGHFEMSLPANSCYHMEGITSIENTAKHLCLETKILRPDNAVKVIISEGFNKGSVFSVK